MNKIIRWDLSQGVQIGDLTSRRRRIAPESDPDGALKDQARVEQIRAVLDAVGVRTREIYFAHRAGFSYAEIAEHMNISQGTIKRHIARALVAIMEHDE
jgi:RNA polymerase sigma factor (sigma-70 family)